MLNNNLLLTCGCAALVALLVSLAATPIVRKYAEKIGAMDVPMDERRMHKKPIPRIGGLAIFLGFIVGTLIFMPLDSEIKSILLGALVIVTLGVIDDIKALSPAPKFAVQTIAALIPVLNGVQIERFSNPFSSGVIDLGILAIPITVIWIVAITNSVNFIDGLDGLACGVSSIATITMFVIAYILKEPDIPILLAALAGSCIGFLPYNLNPAKIFMGDTGALFLGYILACISIQGLFKTYAIVSFALPFITLGIPIFEISSSVFRRVSKGESPMKSDKEHIHHKLINMGFDQKQSVAILYVLSALLGVAAVILVSTNTGRVTIAIVAIILSILIGIYSGIFKRKK